MTKVTKSQACSTKTTVVEGMRPCCYQKKLIKRDSILTITGVGDFIKCEICFREIHRLNLENSSLWMPRSQRYFSLCKERIDFLFLASVTGKQNLSVNK